MAEFCKECFIKIMRPNQHDIENIMMSDDEDVCEGCGEWKIYVDSINPIVKSCSLAELRKMAGQPVWIPEIESYGIVKVDKSGECANRVFVSGTSYSYNSKPFDVGVDFEYDIESRKLRCYKIL